MAEYPEVYQQISDDEKLHGNEAWKKMYRNHYPPAEDQPFTSTPLPKEQPVTSSPLPKELHETYQQIAGGEELLSGSEDDTDRHEGAEDSTGDVSGHDQGGQFGSGSGSSNRTSPRSSPRPRIRLGQPRLPPHLRNAAPPPAPLPLHSPQPPTQPAPQPPPQPAATTTGPASTPQPPSSPKAAQANTGSQNPQVQPRPSDYVPPHMRNMAPMPTPRSEGGDTESTNSSGKMTVGSRGRGSPQMERDQQRVNAAIGSDAQPFRKARSRNEKVTTDNLRRPEMGSGSGSSSRGSGSGSILSDLNLNVPEGWGRRAQRRRNLLARQSAAEAAAADKKDTGELRRSQSDGDFDGKGKAVVDPKNEASETSLRTAGDDLPFGDVAQIVASKKLSMRPLPQPFQKARPSGSKTDDLFNVIKRPDGSQPYSKNAELDAAREREIQSLEKSALTTNRLGELKEKQSLERVGRRPSTIFDVEHQEDLTSDAKLFDTKLVNQKPTDTELVDQNLPDTKLVHQKSTDKKPIHQKSTDAKPPETQMPAAEPSRVDTEDVKAGRVPRESRAETLRELWVPPFLHATDSRQPSKESVIEGSADRPSRKRKDSDDTQDLLRSLSRVPSSSPHQTPSDERLPSEAPSQDRILQPESRPSNMHRKKTSDGVKETPRGGEISTHPKTPVVTGAWVDTPQPATLPTKYRRGPSLTDEGISVSDKVFDVAKKEVEDADALERSAPKLPRSALAAIIEQAKKSKATGANDTLQLNDSTILSLEDLQADPSRRVTTDSHILPADVAATVASPTAGGPASDNVPESLTSSLSHLRASIAESKLGIDTITKRLHRSTSAPGGPEGHPPATEGDHECDEGGVVHDFIVPCEKCAAAGALSASALGGDSLLDWDWHWQSLSVPAPRLWRPRRAADRAPRPTRLGWCFIVFTLLFLAECVTAPAYTPPFYADSMVGYGVDIMQPRPPFVFLKLVAKHSGLNTLAVYLWYGLCVLVRLFAGVAGLDPGIFGHGGGAGSEERIKWVFTDGVSLDPGIYGTKEWGFDADEVL